LVPKLLTIGGIAAALEEPLHRIEYVLRTRRHLEPAALAGHVRLFRAETIDLVAAELRAIDAKRVRPSGLHIVRAEPTS
jgi:hypothetical protein